MLVENEATEAELAEMQAHLDVTLAGQRQVQAVWKEDVRRLGRRVGYGNMMHLAQQCWEETLAATGGPPGGAFVYGPCLAVTVPCGCTGDCGWCCGSGRLTKKVAQLKQREAGRR